MTSTQQAADPRIASVMVGLMVGVFLAALDQTIMSTALPTVVGELGGLDLLPWVFTSYLVTTTVTMPLWGKLSDVFGRRRLFQASVVLFIVGSVAAGVSQSIGQLVFFRAVQGAGAGGIVPLALAVVADMAQPRARSKYVGQIVAVFAAASVSGPLIGGFLVDHLSWRWAFYVNVPTSAIALVLARRIGEPADAVDRSRPIDYAGAALLTLAVGASLLAVAAVERGGWSSPVTVALAATGLVTVLAFGLQERRAADPVLPPALFANRVFSLASLLGALTGIAMFSATVFLPVFLQVVNGFSASRSGVLVMPMMACLFLASNVTGRLITRTGRTAPFVVVGGALVAIGMGVLATLGTTSPDALPSVAVGIIGLGAGMAFPTITLAVQNAVHRDHLGVATSMTQFWRTIGGVFGVAAFGAILNARLASALGDDAVRDLGQSPSELLSSPAHIARLAEPARSLVRQAVADGVGLIFLVATVFAVVAVLASFRLPEEHLADDIVPSPELELG